MTVSGLGSARPSRSPATPPPTRTVPAEKAAAKRNDLDQLTAADRELIFQATGLRIGPATDPVKESAGGFAAAIAAERASGRLLPGQATTAIFLKDLNQRYARAGAANPIAPHLDRAVAFLARSGTRRVDVSA